jgi:hypothetical protein
MKKIIILICLLVVSNAWGSVWVYDDKEEGVDGNPLPDTTSGCTYCEWESSCGTYANDNLCTLCGTLYGSLHMPYGKTSHYVQFLNPSATCGTNSLGTVNLVSGTTYYLGIFTRVDRVGGTNVWTTPSGGCQIYEFGKFLEMYGSGFRWMIDQGSMYQCITTGHYTYGVGCADSAFAACDATDGLEQKQHNVSPYSNTTPYNCDYERWYSVVLGIKYSTTTSGSYTLWINGTKVSEATNIQTGNAGATVNTVGLGGTNCQGRSPEVCIEHYKLTDGIVFTDDVSFLTTSGYFSDPEGGVTTTVPTTSTIASTTTTSILPITSTTSSMGTTTVFPITGITIQGVTLQ